MHKSADWIQVINMRFAVRVIQIIIFIFDNTDLHIIIQYANSGLIDKVLFLAMVSYTTNGAIGDTVIKILISKNSFSWWPVCALSRLYSKQTLPSDSEYHRFTVIMVIYGERICSKSVPKIYCARCPDTRRNIWSQGSVLCVQPIINCQTGHCPKSACFEIQRWIGCMLLSHDMKTFLFPRRISKCAWCFHRN